MEEPSGGVEWTVASIEDDGHRRSGQRPATISALVNLIQEKPARGKVVTPDEFKGGHRPPALLEGQFTASIIKRCPVERRGALDDVLLAPIARVHVRAHAFAEQARRGKKQPN